MGYFAQPARQLCCPAQRMKFIRVRMQRNLEGDVTSVIRGFRRMSALKNCREIVRLRLRQHVGFSKLIAIE